MKSVLCKDNSGYSLETYTFSGRECKITADKLREGNTCKVLGVGNSMTPILKSHQEVICIPVTEDTVLEKKDIVLCKVKGHYYLHLIWAIRGNQYLIGNNHGHANGWITRNSIFGKVTKIL